MKQMQARFAGECQKCTQRFPAGAPINFHGRGQVEHQDCATAPPAPIGGRPRRISSVTRFSSGAVVYQNYNGRCEDAPCCGCCS